MGNQLATNAFKDLPGNIGRYIKRKTRRFNAIPRAEKLLDEIPVTAKRAPLHEATLKQMERLKEEMWDKSDGPTVNKDELHKNLNSVYVKSVGDNIDTFSQKRIRRELYVRPNREQEENAEVPIGKYNITRAEHFLAAHARDSKIYNSDVLADVYKVEKEVMHNILDSVKLFSVVLPVKTSKPKISEKLAKDMMPPGIFQEEDTVIIERRTQHACYLLAKLYKKEYKPPKKLIHDMTFLETLVALKPFKSEIMNQIFPNKQPKSETNIPMNPHTRTYDPVVTPEIVEDDFFRQQTKNRLEETLKLEAGKETESKDSSEPEQPDHSSPIMEEKSDETKEKGTDKKSRQAQK